MFAADPKVSSAVPADIQSSEAICSWKQLIEPVDLFLQQVSEGLSSQVDAFDLAIAPYADYTLNGEGKHLRPALVALTANALGKVTDAHVTVAVIIEMVHVATLVHDDVMDEGEIRRGKLTLATNWGNEIAVLFGDCLFAQALQMAASFPTSEICRAVATATKTVCSGEILQTQHRRDFQFSRESYFKVLEMKTAELFALSCELSGFLNSTDEDERLALRQFGMSFGTAYQLYDDCVDLFGSEATAGKSLGTDLTKGKMTLPVILARDRAARADKETLQHLLVNWQPSSMKDLHHMLAKYDVLNSTVEIVHQHLASARQSLRELPNSKGMSGLVGITQYLARQTDSLLL